MSLLNTEKILIGSVSIEVLGTVLAAQCEEHHRPTHRVAKAQLRNRFTPSSNFLAPKFIGAITSHIFFQYNFFSEWF